LQLPPGSSSSGVPDRCFRGRITLAGNDSTGKADEMMRDEKPQPPFCAAEIVSLGASSPTADICRSAGPNCPRKRPRWHQPEIQANL